MKKNKKESFKEIYEVNFSYVYSFIFSRLSGNKDVIEDIVQETFISAMNALDNFKGTSSYRTWLCGIAKNKILNYYRSSVVKDSINYQEELDSLEDSVDIELTIITSEIRSNIFKTINRLKPIYRYTLILKYMDDYSVKEISEILCKTPKAIDGILQRAKINFKNEYIKISGDE